MNNVLGIVFVLAMFTLLTAMGVYHLRNAARDAERSERSLLRRPIAYRRVIYFPVSEETNRRAVRTAILRAAGIMELAMAAVIALSLLAIIYEAT